MLTATENKILSCINKLCEDRESVLVSPTDIIKISGVKEVTTEKLDKILTELNMDGYFDLIFSDRRGEKIYCITLSEKGKGYFRSVKVLKRNVLFRIGLTSALAVLSFLIGLILKRIF